MAVTLRPMNDEELVAWLPGVIDGYAADMATNGGVKPDEARTRAREQTEMLFPGGRPAPEQLVFVVEADGERVGELWVSERENDGRRVLWVFSIEIGDRHRGKGFGRIAMEHAEEIARQRGLSHVALNVFGGNETARRLYRGLGYSEDAVWMSKPIG
jgi:GNAT superfamily N-acetyltransferase